MTKNILFLIILLSCSVSFASERLSKYGVERTINFEVYEVDGVDLRTDWTPVQADCEIMKDEGTSTACTNTATDEGSTYSIVLTATEMQAARLVLKLVDAATKVFLDTVVYIETYGNASAMHAFDLDTASVAQSADNDTKISTLITGVDLNNDAITAAKIAADAIGASEIATDAIGAAELAADAIGASEIATDAIGAAEIAADAIGTAEIATDAIGATEIAADAITSSELAATAATKIVDDWESQSQADPTGFHVNVLEVAGTSQTANDNGADINSILTDTTEIGVAGAGLSNINLPNQAMDIVGSITGNLSGSVGSVTGAVGSVTGAVGSVAGNVDGSIGSLGATAKTDVNTEVDGALDTALPASPTTGSINDILDRQEETIVNGSAATGTLSTTTMTTDLTITVNDQYNGRIITFRKDTSTAALQGQQTDITDTVTTNGQLTFTALTTAPANGDTFEIN